MIATILNSAILDSAMLHKGLTQTSSFSQTYSLNLILAILNFPSWICHKKKNFSHSFWLNLMMAAILNSAILDSDTAILDSDTLLSSLRFTQKHSSSTLTLTQTNSIWLNLMMAFHLEFCHDCSHFAQNSDSIWIQSDSNSFILTQLDDGSHLELCHHGFSHFAQKNFTHSFWLNLVMAAILNSAILDSDTAILDSNTLLSSLRLTQKTLFLQSDPDSN